MPCNDKFNIPRGVNSRICYILQDSSKSPAMCLQSTIMQSIRRVCRTSWFASSSLCGFSGSYGVHAPSYWVVQAVVLTPLTFTRHRLSPLAVFTSRAYWLSSQWKAVTVYSANFKGIFGRPIVRLCLATSKNLLQKSTTTKQANKQKRIFPTLSRSFWSAGKRGKYFPPPPPPPIFYLLFSVILANATVVAFVLLRNSRLNVHCYTQGEPTLSQRPARKWQLRLFAPSFTKNYKGHSLVQTSFAELPKNPNRPQKQLLLIAEKPK